MRLNYVGRNKRMLFICFDTSDASTNSEKFWCLAKFIGKIFTSSFPAIMKDDNCFIKEKQSPAGHQVESSIFE